MKNHLKRLLVNCLLGAAVLVTAGTVRAQDFEYNINPPYLTVSGPNAGADCATLPSGKALACYSPAMIRAAYNAPYSAPPTFAGVQLNGQGQMIAIIVAFGSPTLVSTASPAYSTSDLAVFDSTFGLPDPPSLTIIGSNGAACPAGCPVFNPSDTQHNETGWALETTLDVEYAHAMAPGANIAVVVATTNAADAINAALSTAVNLLGVTIISQSFGQPEYLLRSGNTEVTQAHSYYEQAQTNKITVLAAAGDRGATNGLLLVPNASYPASDPLVLAVGGTQGRPYPGGLYPSTAYGAEQVWNEDDLKDKIVWATGGSPSILFSLPTFQDGLHLVSRTIPDVSFNAALNGGVLVYSTAIGGDWYVMGGTGAAAPQWAGVISMVNQESELVGFPSAGYINPALYALAQGTTAGNDFHDITTGNNLLFGTLFGFLAKKGYDPASGWGTPNITNFVSDLAAALDK